VQPRPLPIDYPRRHFLHGVTSALVREGHLLTWGERQVVQRWLDLPPGAASIYARLHGRAGTIFRLDRLAYAEVPDLPAAADQLLRAGLADPRGLIHLDALIHAHTVPELRAACRALGLPRGGPRGVLVERLERSRCRSVLPGTCIRLRHQGLFRRLLRIYLGDHQGDLSRVVMDALGLQTFARYTSTGGPGLFRNRQGLRDYESALRLLSEERDEPAWAAQAESALARMMALPRESVARRKFSARRLYDRASRRAIRAVERQSGSAAAAPLYLRLLRHHTERPAEMALRLALCQDRMGDAAAGAALCAAARAAAQGTPTALALERTGRRLARRAEVPWAPAPDLVSAPVRHLVLPMVQVHPPRFGDPECGLPVEAAVVAHLAGLGRRALHGESAPWTTLFGLLFYSVLFAPVPGMLPSQKMNGPLDLYTPGFASRRSDQINGVLARIAEGQAPAMLMACGAEHMGEGIAGVHWGLLSLEDLAALAAHIGPVPLHALMALFARDPRTARGGMPDLLVLPGSDHFLPPGLLMAEVKGPGDQLRDNQRCWHHALLQAGLSVEVWRVQAEGAG